MSPAVCAVTNGVASPDPTLVQCNSNCSQYFARLPIEIEYAQFHLSLLVS